MTENLAQRQHGQFFTMRSPFSHPAFLAWAEQADIRHRTVLEPFAGSNNLIHQLREKNLIGQSVSMDIHPQNEEVMQRDTLTDFPEGYHSVVTNPPWLARNSATRRKLNFPETPWDDLYQVALETCLRHCPYVAAILPESFLQSRFPKTRCTHVVSITGSLFDNTEHPTCLALFSPDGNNPSIWSSETLLGTLSELSRWNITPQGNVPMVFNCPQGNIGLRAVDSTSGPSIAFVPGDSIAPELIKVSSRAITRIAMDGPDEEIIAAANNILHQVRENTHDVFLTSFKGVRKDGLYRRRLDFATARAILEHALSTTQDPH